MANKSNRNDTVKFTNLVFVQCNFDHPLVNKQENKKPIPQDYSKVLDNYFNTLSDGIIFEGGRQIINLNQIALVAEFVFTLMFSIEVLAKDVALFGYAGFFLGICYLLVQTYVCCFNYWFDCIYRSQFVTKKQMNVLKPLTLSSGFISAVFLSMSVISNGLTLYNFKFLEVFFSHRLTLFQSHRLVTALTIGLIFIAAIINFIGSMAHICYNLSKFKVGYPLQNRSSKKGDSQKTKSKLDKANKNKNTTAIESWLEMSRDIFFSATKLRWLLSIINCGFLFYASFNWCGFLIGAVLTILYIFDESIFLLSCDPSQWKKIRCSIYQLKWRYSFASIFSVSYSTYLVYINLNYFCNQFLPTSNLVNLIFSIFTAVAGVIAGVIRKYKIYQQVKKDYIKKWFETHGTEIVKISQENDLCLNKKNLLLSPIISN